MTLNYRCISMWPFGSREPGVNIQAYDRKLTPEELFFQRNRAEVRQIYRDILKLTAAKMPRKLQREAKIAVSVFPYL